jgi:hypothetical protein
MVQQWSMLFCLHDLVERKGIHCYLCIRVLSGGGSGVAESTAARYSRKAAIVGPESGAASGWGSTLHEAPAETVAGDHPTTPCHPTSVGSPGITSALQWTSRRAPGARGQAPVFPLLFVVQAAVDASCCQHLHTDLQSGRTHRCPKGTPKDTQYLSMRIPHSAFRTVDPLPPRPLRDQNSLHREMDI